MTVACNTSRRQWRWLWTGHSGFSLLWPAVYSKVCLKQVFLLCVPLFSYVFQYATSGNNHTCVCTCMLILCQAVTAPQGNDVTDKFSQVISGDHWTQLNDNGKSVKKLNKTCSFVAHLTVLKKPFIYNKQVSHLRPTAAISVVLYRTMVKLVVIFIKLH